MEALECVFEERIDKNGNAYYVYFSHAPCSIDMSDSVLHLFKHGDTLKLVFSKFDKSRQKKVDTDDQGYNNRKRERVYRY